MTMDDVARETEPEKDKQLTVIDRRAGAMVIPGGSPAAMGAPSVPTPAALYNLALAYGAAGLDRLERLLQMHLEWERREAEKTFTRALAAFKARAPIMPRNRHVKFLSVDYHYTELHVAVDLCTPILSDCGLSFTWSPIEDGTRVGVEGILQHVDGHQRAEKLFGPPDDKKGMNTTQKNQSTRTALARQLYFMMLGLASGLPDDDAGQESAPAEDEKTPASPPQPAQNRLDRAGHVLGAFKPFGVLAGDLEGPNAIGKPIEEWSEADFTAAFAIYKELKALDPEARAESVAKRFGAP